MYGSSAVRAHETSMKPWVSPLALHKPGQWYPLVIPALRRGSQANQRFKIILSYIMSLRLAGAARKPRKKKSIGRHMAIL